MRMNIIKYFFTVSLFIFSCPDLLAQLPEKKDTFFLSGKKGLLGRLGKSITTSPEPEAAVKISDQYEKFSGRVIRSVEILNLDFNQNLDDTAIIKDNLFIRIAKRVHYNTRTSVINNHLFFKKGDKLRPLLISDNESFLRNQPFLQDALIIVTPDPVTDDSVDIVVLTRDVFSIGGSMNANTSRVRAELREENLAGTGAEISVSGIYDLGRNPKTGFGAELIVRNIGGSFLNVSTGMNTFQNAFNSGRFEENKTYLTLEKPLVNRYTNWTAYLEVSANKTFNAYIGDSLYQSDFRYKYSNVDIWTGYNIGGKNKEGRDSYKHLRHFIAIRTFYRKFDVVPAKFNGTFRFEYADINGALFSYSLYRQNIYRTNYLYAFGRYENIPVGMSASIITGWTNKENRRRPYYGLEFEGSRFSQRGFFSYYKLKAGGWHKDGKLEDVDLLMSIDHFTRLRKLASRWRNRNFISFSFTRQMNYTINTPLFLKSDFGLPYFRGGSIEADERATFKLESDFYNLNKVLGFRCAPFLFGDYCILKPVNQPLAKSDGFSAFGGGIRVRNENLVFGTIELKGFYFPRTIDGMNNWKAELVTKVRFRYNSNFIRKPDFIATN